MMLLYVGLSDAELAQLAPGLDYDTVMAQYGRIPSVQDRRLNLLQQDIPLPTDEINLERVCTDYKGFRAAAAAWTTDSEAEEFWDHLEKKEWVQRRPGRPDGKLVSLMSEPGGLLYDVPAVCALDARLWVEEQLRERGTGQRVFVAMWFDESLNEAYKEGFAKGTVQAVATADLYDVEIPLLLTGAE